MSGRLSASPSGSGAEGGGLARVGSEEVERLADFEAALRPRVEGQLRTDPLARAIYATDASMYQVPPLGVLLPRCVEDVLAAVEEAARFDLPILPRGSGTSLAGSAVGAALVVDTTRHLDGVLDFDPEARTVTVQPGLVLDQLNAFLAAGERPLRVGPDPASSSRATLGGMVATNATGTRSIRYGSVVDHVVSARAVLTDGTPVELGALDPGAWEARTRTSGREGELYRALDALLSSSGEAVRRGTPPHWRRAGGYRLERLLEGSDRNLAHLLCGSEGTLAFLTEVTLRVVDRPPRAVLGVAHFPTRRAALEAVAPILGTDPSAVELFDRIALVRAREVEAYRSKLHFLEGDPGALLIVEYDGEHPHELSERLDALERILGPGETLSRCESPLQMRDVWDVRKVGLGLAMSARLPMQCLAFIEDAAVPVEHLPDYVARLEAVLEAHGTDAVMYAHASAGCLHVRPFLDTRREDEVRRMEAIASASAELVREYGGILSSEHGDGLARSWLAPGFYGKELYDAYVGVKRTFDPEGRFNPGRVVEAPPMTENLRNSRPLQVLPVRTEMDWSASGGFARAVESCNGQGVCRKLGGGAMCPPFMVTREEQDSTRGRANALRLVLSGDLPASAMTGPELEEAMDLCVSCKACRAECPAAVDMAAMKSEWQAMLWRTRRPPLRTRMIAHQPRVARLVAGPLAPFANWLQRGALGRRVFRSLGFAPGRALPPFARHPFRDSEGTRPQGDYPGIPRGARPRVLLYADTFARFHEPGIARDAVRVLEAGGFEVVVPPYRCCGRTLISKGFLEQARESVRRVVEVLHPLLEEGVRVVGLEPSCLLTLRDEAMRLLPGDPRVAEVAAAARTFEEFVAEERERFAGCFREPREPILLHGHCHQKALSGVAPGIACLETAGYVPRELDAGCCGMAGSFGYEAEHEDLSRAMAERVLAPAVRAAGPEAAVAAPGTSCRHQIQDVTGHRALHPAQHLARRLLP